MKLVTPDKALAQKHADDFYSRLKVSDPQYAANMKQWDIPHPEMDVNGKPTGNWFVNVDGGIVPVMLTTEIQSVPELVAISLVDEVLL